MNRFTRTLVLLGIAAAAVVLAGGALGMTYTTPVGVFNSSADSPTDLAVNSEGDLWVLYTGGNTPRIARLNVIGAQQVSVPISTADAMPLGITTDAAGNAYVTDSNNETITVYSKSGALLHTYTDPAHLNGPVGIGVSSSGTIYVADAGNDQVEVFSSSGAFTSQFGAGTLSVPNDVAVDSGGNVWVADSGNDQIVEYSGSGSQLLKFGTRGHRQRPVRDPGVHRRRSDGERVRLRREQQPHPGVLVVGPVREHVGERRRHGRALHESARTRRRRRGQRLRL